MATESRAAAIRRRQSTGGRSVPTGETVTPLSGLPQHRDAIHPPQVNPTARRSHPPFVANNAETALTPGTNSADNRGTGGEGLVQNPSIKTAIEVRRSHAVARRLAQVNKKVRSPQEAQGNNQRPTPRTYASPEHDGLKNPKVGKVQPASLTKPVRSE